MRRFGDIGCYTRPVSGAQLTIRRTPTGAPLRLQKSADPREVRAARQGSRKTRQYAARRPRGEREKQCGRPLSRLPWQNTYSSRYRQTRRQNIFEVVNHPERGGGRQRPDPRLAL